MYIKHISVNTLCLNLIKVEKQGKTLWVAGRDQFWKGKMKVVSLRKDLEHSQNEVGRGRVVPVCV